MIRVTSLEGSILALLARDGEQSGWDLLRAASTSVAHFVPVGRSQLYAALPRLEQRGLISTRRVPQESRPDKSVHTITESGRQALTAWVNEPTEDAGRDSWLVKLFFGAYMSRRQLREHITVRRQSAARLLDELDAMLDTPDLDDLFHRLTREWGRRHAEATVAWADDALSTLWALEQD